MILKGPSTREREAPSPLDCAMTSSIDFVRKSCDRTQTAGDDTLERAAFTPSPSVMPRVRPIAHRVTMELDGEPVIAELGEPVAVALIGAGVLALARSPKFHRPRGPACLRGACDGCLARVDGVPNVMTCRIPAAAGMRIEVQNVVGSRETDLLRMADWFFPDGMNHHELFAGVPGLERAVQPLARRVAGLGTLPEASGRMALAARRRDADVLVVGSGPGGMAAAVELAKRGRSVEVIDDDLHAGGCARVLAEAGDATWRALLDAFDDAVAGVRVTLRLRTTAAGIYGRDLVVSSSSGRDRIEVVTARTLVLAPGAHDGTLAFEGNDTPGVMSARAACRLAMHGVIPGERAVVLAVDGSGAFASAYAAADPRASLVRGTPLRVTGGARVARQGRVRKVTLATPEGERDLPCDALVIDAARSPAYELCQQAGAALLRESAGFVVQCQAGGRIGDGVFAIGEVTGASLDPDAIGRAAREIADAAG
ncbi:MAG: 2Fe-2S iron-sulfur cluster-binding protein [Polyangiaceae bacterium]